MLDRYTSRSGALSASYQGKHLHSSFDPEGEARRYVATELTVIPRTVILIGPALGYLVRAVSERRPDCHVISMFLLPACYRYAVTHGGSSWHPGSGSDPADYLLSALDEIETSSLTVLEWSPSVRSFRAEANRVRQAVSEVVRRHQASLLTEGANGRRWASNLVRNFSNLVRPIAALPNGEVDISACVIAAAGPSLETALELIKSARSKISLWSTGSALDAVLARGLEPDLIISTDSAVYATEHLRAASVDAHHRYPIAAPLSASRGIGDSAPVWPLSNDDHFESTLYDELKIDPMSVPAHGTVTGTAIHLALGLQRWPVIVAGMDLGWLGTRSHVRPHLTQVYRNSVGFRLAPPLTGLYRQMVEMVVLRNSWRTDRALQVYAAWFERALALPGQRVRRLLPSPAAETIPWIDAESFSALPRRFHRVTFESVDWPDKAKRWEGVRAVTKRCADELRLLSEARDPLPPSRTQLFFLRRLAMDKLIKWHRSNSLTELRSAARTASDLLSTIGGLV